jgi:DNA-binding MarR family transcriptional regulator
MTKRARIERKVWDASSQTFVGTGEVTEGEMARLEKLAPKLSNRGRYLKGPVPWEWIAATADLPGKAWLVGLCIWRLSGAKNSKTVRLGNADLKPLGIDRAAKSRALQALENAGLITVKRDPGRFPIVTLQAPDRSRQMVHPAVLQ